MVFGRTLRDFLPAMIHKYEPAKDWVVTQEYRERTLTMKREMDDKRWSQRTPVSIQNQTVNHPNKGDKPALFWRTSLTQKLFSLLLLELMVAVE